MNIKFSNFFGKVTYILNICNYLLVFLNIWGVHCIFEEFIWFISNISVFIDNFPIFHKC